MYWFHQSKRVRFSVHFDTNLVYRIYMKISRMAQFSARLLNKFAGHLVEWIFRFDKWVLFVMSNLGKRKYHWALIDLRLFDSNVGWIELLKLAFYGHKILISDHQVRLHSASVSVTFFSSYDLRASHLTTQSIISLQNYQETKQQQKKNFKPSLLSISRALPHHYRLIVCNF